MRILENNKQWLRQLPPAICLNPIIGGSAGEWTWTPGQLVYSREAGLCLLSACPPFTWVLGIQTTVPKLMQLVYPLSPFPFPTSKN